jgi:Na+/proline symporter
MTLASIVQTAELPTLVQPATIWVAVAYFIVVAAIGTWALRRTRTAGDFFLAGRGIGLWALTLSAMAATLSGFAFIGGPGLLYSVGLGALFIMLPASITGAMGAWVLAKRLRLLGEVRGLMTVPDAIGARYRSRLAQGLAAIAILIAVIGYLATNLLALGLVINAIFGIGIGPAIWLGMAITLAYSVTGGILAGIYTDIFQGSLMALAAVLVFVNTMQVGDGLSEISRTIMIFDPEFLGPWGKFTPLAALSLFFVFGIGSLGQPHVIHKFYMLKDARQLRWFPLLMTLSLLITTLLFFGVGVSMKALVVRGELAPLASPDLATPTFLLGFGPTLLAGIVLAGVVAAIMSTVNSFLSVGAAALMHDLPVALGRTSRNPLRVGRAYTILISVLAAVLAQFSGTLVIFLGIFGFGLFASTLVPALAIGLNWPGATRAGAIASISVGLLLTLIGETLAYFRVYTFPVGVSIAGLSLVLAFIAFFVVSWLTRAGAEAGLDEDVRLVMDI